jgi:hypothetical protein
MHRAEYEAGCWLNNRWKQSTFPFIHAWPVDTSDEFIYAHSIAEKREDDYLQATCQKKV